VQLGSGICRSIFHDALPGRTLMVKNMFSVCILYMCAVKLCA
jgi:hypothetical protein